MTLHNTCFKLAGILMERSKYYIELATQEEEITSQDLHELNSALHKEMGDAIREYIANGGQWETPK